MKTQVAVVGGGPAGLLLAHLLHQAGIECVVLERRDRAYVEGRVRAGVLEQTTVDILRRLGLSERLDREGLSHDGFSISFDDDLFRIDLAGLTGGKRVTVYGQSEVMKDLFDAAVARDLRIVFDAEHVQLHGIASDASFVTWEQNGKPQQRLDCELIAGCDGFHGVSRCAIPPEVVREYEKVYPFAWLGILADVPPADHELIYASHERGFALASTIARGQIDIKLGGPAIANALDLKPEEIASPFLQCSRTFQMRRRGVENRLLLGDDPVMQGPALFRFVARAHVWWEQIRGGSTVGALAKHEGVTTRLISLHLPAAFLAPDIVELILEGRQPQSLTAQALRTKVIPALWDDQRVMFGIAGRIKKVARTLPAA